MKSLFHIIEEGSVVLRSKGTFYQKRVYRRENRIFASWGTGFIRIGPGDATSNPHVSWESLDLPFQHAKGPCGEPLIPEPILVPVAKAA